MKIRTRFVLSYLGLALVLLGLSTLFIYLFSSKILFSNVKSQLISVAQTTALIIDTEKHQSFNKASDETTDAYVNEIKKLQAVQKNNPNFYSLYTIIKKEGDYHYILDTPTIDDKTKSQKKYRIMDREHQLPLEAMLVFKNGQARVNPKAIIRKGKYVLSAYAPIKDNTGNLIGILGVDLEAASVEALLSTLFKRTLLAFGIALALALLVAAYFTHMIYKPFNLFFEATRKISDGDLNYRISYNKKDEIKDLANSFNQMITDLRVTKGQVENSARIAEETVKERTQELKQLNLTLLQEKMQAESLLNSIGEGVFGIDRQGIIIFSNPVAQKLIGLKNQPLLGRDMVKTFGHLDKNKKIFSKQCDPILKVIDTAKPLVSENEFFSHQSSEPFPVQYIATPLRFSEEVSGAIVVFQDITKRRELDNLKDNFIATVSHELRTPLTSIIGNSSLILNDIQMPDDKKRTFVGIIEKQGRNLLSLINDLLDISRLEAGKFQLNLEFFDLQKIVDDSVAANRLAAKDKSIVVEKLWLTTQQDAYADPLRVTQVLNNLLNNAIKFSPEKTKVQVIIRNSVENHGFFQISIKDQGVGISQDKIPQLFQRFYQLDSTASRKFGGSGLGLSIAKDIVELHGGKIWIQSFKKKGSEFFFTVPQQKFDNIILTKKAKNEEITYH